MKREIPVRQIKVHIFNKLEDSDEYTAEPVQGEGKIMQSEWWKKKILGLPFWRKKPNRSVQL